MWYKIANANPGENIENDSTCEKWTKVDPNDEASKFAESVIEGNELRISFDGIAEVESTDTEDAGDKFYLATYAGGMNGGALDNKWCAYLDYIKEIISKLGRSWLVELYNDCCDDVWYLVVGFRYKKEK